MGGVWLWSKTYGSSKVLEVLENSSPRRLGLWIALTSSIVVAFGKRIKLHNLFKKWITQTTCTCKSKCRIKSCANRKLGGLLGSVLRFSE